jgi:hypothetical protein
MNKVETYTEEELDELLRDMEIRRADWIYVYAADAIRSLRTRCVQLERDARRLDWLDRNMACIEPVVGNIVPEGSYAIWHDEDHEPDIGPNIRDAIDAAMSEGAIGFVGVFGFRFMVLTER